MFNVPRQAHGASGRQPTQGAAVRPGVRLVDERLCLFGSLRFIGGEAMPAITSGVVVSALDANGVRTGNAHVAPCGFGIGGKQGKGCADPMGLALGSALLWGSLGATAPGHVLGNRSRTCCAGSFVSGLEQLRPPGIQTRTFRAPMFGPLKRCPRRTALTTTSVFLAMTRELHTRSCTESQSGRFSTSVFRPTVTKWRRSLRPRRCRRKA